MKNVVCSIKGHVKVSVRQFPDGRYARDDNGDRVACRRCRKVLPNGTNL